MPVSGHLPSHSTPMLGGIRYPQQLEPLMSASSSRTIFDDGIREVFLKGKQVQRTMLCNVRGNRETQIIGARFTVGHLSVYGVNWWQATVMVHGLRDLILVTTFDPGCFGGGLSVSLLFPHNSFHIDSGVVFNDTRQYSACFTIRL